MIATSGIDYDVKLWEPLDSERCSLHDLDKVSIPGLYQHVAPVHCVCDMPGQIGLRLVNISITCTYMHVTTTYMLHVHACCLLHVHACCSLHVCACHNNMHVTCTTTCMLHVQQHVQQHPCYMCMRYMYVHVTTTCTLHVQQHACYIILCTCHTCTCMSHVYAQHAGDGT